MFEINHAKEFWHTNVILSNSVWTLLWEKNEQLSIIVKLNKSFWLKSLFSYQNLLIGHRDDTKWNCKFSGQAQSKTLGLIKFNINPTLSVFWSREELRGHLNWLNRWNRIGDLETLTKPNLVITIRYKLSMFCQ